MANGTRTLTLVVVLIIGLAAGWLIGRGQAPPAPAPQPTPVPTAVGPPPTPVPTLTAGHHLIEVGPAASQVSENQAAVSKVKDHKVIWIAKDETKKMEIWFKKADFPPAAGGEPPFKGPNGQDLVIKCKANETCKSGHINSNLHPGDNEKLSYKYWQVLIDAQGHREEADAVIIIEP